MKAHSLPHHVRFLGAALLAISAQVASALDYPSTVLSYNPVGYWRMSETAAVPAPNILVNSGSLGSAANGYPTPFGISNPAQALTNGVPGVVGTAISFMNPNGASANFNSMIDVPYNPAFNPKGPFTVEFWAQAAGAWDANLLAAVFSVNTDESRSGWLVYLDGPGSPGSGPAASWNFRIGGTASYAASVWSSNVVVTAGTWYHVVSVYDGANILLYVNGELSAPAVPATSGAGYNPNSNKPLRIGGTTFFPYPNGGSGRGYNGVLDELAFYNGVLNATTISNHYYMGTHNTAGYSASVQLSSPLGYWHMDEPPYTSPPPSSLPVTANLGTLGAAANGTNHPGLTAGVAGPPFAGFPASNLGSGLSYAAGYVDLGNANGASLVPSGLNFSNQITMIAWVKPQYTDGLRNIMAHGYRNSPDQEVQFRINAGAYEVGSWAPGEGAVSAAGRATADTGNWVFLAGTFDGANWNLYRYDTLLTSTPGSSGALLMDAPWAIGSRGDPSIDGRWFGGSLDEVAIFTNALTTAQIQNIFYAAKMSPVFLKTPQAPSGTVFEGESLSFSVEAAGNPTLMYQWYKNSSPLGGATGTSLALNNVTTGSSGTYAIVVTNNYGAITSSFAVTVVAGPPLVTQQPQDATRFIGGTVTFTSAAIGSPPIAPQWYYNTNTAIGGANAASYTKANLQVSDAGKYNCRFSNTAGVTNSAYATLTVNSAPSTPYPGTALADNPIAYWRLDEASGTVAHDYWGGHDGVYHSATLGQTGYAYGFAGFEQDKAAGFSAINTYVGGITGIDFAGASAFSVEAWVNGPATQPADGASTTVDGGATIIGKGRGGNGAGGVNGWQFVLDVRGGKYTFTVQSGSGVGTAAAAQGPNGFWQHVVGVYDNGNVTIYVNGNPGGSGSGPAGGPLATAIPTSIGAGQGGVTPNQDLYFRGTIDEPAVYNFALSAAQVKNHYCAQFGGSQAPLIFVQPVPVTDYVGWPISMSVFVAGSCDLTYQWKKGNTPLLDGGTISGANSQNLLISALDLSDAGNYSVTTANGLGSTNSAVAVVKVLTAPTNDIYIPNLVMHLKFDGNLTDSTGRGNNGSGLHAVAPSLDSPASAVTRTPIVPGNTNSPNSFFQYVPNGQLGQALHYSSDAGPAQNAIANVGTNNFYVTLGVRPDLKFSSNVDYSVSYWVRLPNEYDKGDLPFFCDATNSTGGKGFTFATSYGSNGVFSAGTEANSGAWAWSLNATRIEGPWYSINDNNWHHLLHTYNRAGNGITYLDGVQVDSRSVAAAGNMSTLGPASIGSDPTGAYAETGEADIDDLGVWRRSLTALEAKGVFVAATNAHSFVDLTLSIQAVGGNQVTLTWQTGTLQQANLVTGGYADVPGATSPYTIPASATQKYYRVRQ